MSETELSGSEPLALQSGAHQRLLDLFAEELGDKVIDTHQARGDLWVRVANEAWHDAFVLLRHNLGWKYFVFLSGIDWMLNPTMSAEGVFKGEDAAEASDGDGADGAGAEGGGVPAEAESNLTSGYCGSEGRFQAFARINDLSSGVGVTLKADLVEPDLRIASVSDVFRGADWHEREAFEMYGFDFAGHPGLRKLYLPAEFEGHPLRKDFPLLAREVKPWPGIVNVEPIPDHLDPKKIEEARAAEAAATVPAEGSAGDGTETVTDPEKEKAKADRVAALLSKSKARKGGTGSEAPEEAETATEAARKVVDDVVAPDGGRAAEDETADPTSTTTGAEADAADKPANDRLAALMERSKQRKKELEGDQ